MPTQPTLTDPQSIGHVPEVVPAAALEPTGLALVIERLAANPSVDVSKLEKIIELQERILRHESEAAFNAAFATMQPEIPVILERGQGDGGKWAYAPLEDIIAPLRPILAKHGFSLSHETQWPDAKTVRVIGILTHRAGAARRSEFQSVADQTGSKNAVQSLGSAVAYGRRYTTKDLLCIVTRGEDDDAAAAAARPAPEPPTVKGAVTFENWRDDMLAKADEGQADFDKAWADSPLPFRLHLAKTTPRDLAKMRTTAAKVTKAAQAAPAAPTPPKGKR